VEVSVVFFFGLQAVKRESKIKLENKTRSCNEKCCIE